MTVYIAQCLCPQRHTILAAARECADITDAQRLLPILRVKIETMMREGWLNGHCGICGALESTWIFDVGATRWATLDEARPALAAEQAKMAITAAIFGSAKPGEKPN